MSTTPQTKSHHSQASPTSPTTPPAPKELEPLESWAYPFTPLDANATVNQQTYFNALSHAEDGFYPLGANGIWHGGIHFGAGTAGSLKQEDGVRAIADGEVIAYRLDTKYAELKYSDGKVAMYSTGFVLVHHKLALPPVPVSTTSSTSGGTPASSSGSANSGSSNTSGTSQSNTPPKSPPADEVLDFYSLYMHQLDWAGYQAAEKNSGADGNTAASIQRMPFWQGQKHFKVGKKAPDTQSQPSKFSFAAPASASLSDSSSDLLSPGAPTGLFGANLQSGSSFNLADPNNSQQSSDPLGNFSLPNPTAAQSGNQSAANTAPAVQGIHIRKHANGELLGLLPQGSEIVVADTVVKGWAQIIKIVKGTPVGAVIGDPPDPAAATGWVFISQLESLIEPNPLDTVVVLDPPYPVTAGTVVGYLGEYQRYRDARALPQSPKRPVLHLEVFAGPTLDAFIKKSQDRAKSLPKTMLVVSAGATLVSRAASDRSVDQGLKLKLTADDPKSGPWAKVQPMQASAPSGSHGTGHTHHHAAETPQGDPLWVERAVAGTVTAEVTHGWNSFPLQLSNAKAPAAAFQDVFSQVELDGLDDSAKAVDDNKVHWWLITVGTGKGDSVSGWVSEKGHPDTQWQNPWAWPGFQTIDNTSVSIVNAFKRSLFVSGELLDGEEESFKPDAVSVNSSELITKLEKAIDRNADGMVTAQELAAAQSTPWLAEALSHFIVRYETEWGGGMGKWDALSSLMKDRGFIWQSELQRIQKLQWWDQAKAAKGFPADTAVYHFHPIGLIGNFAGASSGKIAWGAKVSLEFKQKVIQICKDLQVNPDYLMSAMAFESGETFRANVKNPHSGATGLIQFMPDIAPIYGTTTTALAAMTNVEQLDYVKKYFSDSIGKLHTLADVYMRIFWPKAIGKPEDYVIAEKWLKDHDGNYKLDKQGNKILNSVYTQNSGFDTNHDDKFTKGEAATLVQQKYDKGMGSGYYG